MAAGVFPVCRPGFRRGEIMAVIITIIVCVLVVLFVAERRWPGAVTRMEEGALALILGTITLVSFGQVIARYGFSTGWGGALEFTRILFAWLILFGMSYTLKMNSHLGVDAIVRMLPGRWFRAVAVFGAVACLLYAVIFLYSDWLQMFGANARGGALDYWAKMYKIGIGLTDLRYPQWAQHAFGLKDRVQRWVAYLILPVGLALFAYRALEAIIAIARGDQELIIASHEAEDLVADNRTSIEE
jgi:C4-dicarboxylate transporter, DctQ subunit